MKAGRFKQWAAGIVAIAAPFTAFAQHAEPARWQLNMDPGVTMLSHNAYQAHMQALWICVVIGALVFGAMAVALFRFRKSRGAVADRDFTHSTKLEIVWTIIPVVLLVLMAVPATVKLIKMYRTGDAAMTVKITGYQWLWKYEYLGEGVGFTSRLASESDVMRQSGQQPTMAENRYYLREVDHMLVLPTDTKIRFVITADDVIHSWWVPALGWKQDAIPGIVNEAWTDIRKPGIYRGQCAELCGKGHGFMPIVIKAVPKAEFQQWLAVQKATDTGAAPPAAPALPTLPGPVAPSPVEGPVVPETPPDSAEVIDATSAASAQRTAAAGGLSKSLRG